MASRRAFTLLEMLISLGIVALLISLLVPAIGRVSHSGRVAKDMTQMRHLQLAHIAYMNDNDQHLIDVGLAHGGVTTPEDEARAWINTLQDYYDNNLILRSPLDRSQHWEAINNGQGGKPLPGSTDRFRRTSYGCNDYLSRTYGPGAYLPDLPVYDRLHKIRDHRNTVNFVIMTDTGDFAGSDHIHVSGWWLSAGQPDLPPTAAANQVQTNAVGGKARSWDAQSNYAFVDGHVASHEFSEVYLNPERNRFDPEVSALFLMRTEDS